MDDFPLLRKSLDAEYAELSESGLDALVQQIYGPEATAEAVEGFFGDIGRGLSGAARGVGRFAQTAAPALARALPSVAQGASGGAAFGPWGALIGAGAGLTSGLLSQSSNKTARGIGGAIHGVGNLVSTVRGGGASGALGSLTSVATGALGNTGTGRAARGAMNRARGSAGASGAAGNALAGLLARPELVQSLLASLMGSAGRQSVPVGGTQVPVHQMLSALSTVSGRAAQEMAEYDENAEQTPEYAEAAAETFGLDADDAESRTDALLTLLAVSPAIWGQRPAPVTVQVAPDPWFPGGEQAWSEDEEDWDGEDWDGEDWSGEDDEYASGWVDESEDDGDSEDDEHWDFESDDEYEEAEYV